MSRVFIARRADGLGERLKAILNAMVLAELTGGRFIFQWRMLSKADAPFHDIVPPEQMFDKQFLLEHFRPGLSEHSIQPLSACLDDIVANRQGNGEIIQVEQNVFDEELKNARWAIALPDAFRKAFAKIKFHPSLERVRRLAMDSDLPEGTPAIHLRAGDIVYGWHRFTGRFVNKLFPYPIAIALVRECHSRGKVPLIFGQDSNFIEWLREAEQVKVAADRLTGDNWTSLQRAFFDIFLMARCNEIYAGTSGFPALAAKVSGSKLIQPHKYLGDARRRAIIRDCLTNGPTDPRISSLQRALAIWALLESSRGEMEPGEELGLIRSASDLDPVNPIYALHEAANRYACAEEEEGEQRLFRQLVPEGEAQRVFVRQMLYRPINGQVLASPYLKPFDAAAQKGYPLAAFCVALSERALTIPMEARHSADRYKRVRPETLAHLDEFISEAPATRGAKI